MRCLESIGTSEVVANEPVEAKTEESEKEPEKTEAPSFGSISVA